MRPTDLVRMLNAAGLGEVINERQLYRHRKRAGEAVCRGKKVDVIAYTAWLATRLTDHRRQKAQGGAISAPNVRQLFERQEYRCALTGCALSPETSALDHILPVSRGGEHVIANVQILHKQVNRAKGTLTNEEFIQLCREVVAHAASTNAKQTEEQT